MTPAPTCVYTAACEEKGLGDVDAYSLWHGFAKAASRRVGLQDVAQLSELCLHDNLVTLFPLPFEHLPPRSEEHTSELQSPT